MHFGVGAFGGQPKSWPCTPIVGVTGDILVAGALLVTCPPAGVTGDMPLVGVTGDMPLAGVTGDMPIVGVTGDMPLAVVTERY